MATNSSNKGTNQFAEPRVHYVAWPHRSGRPGRGYYIDVPFARGGTHHRSGDTAKARACFRSAALLHSALEHGMLEQMQKTNRAAVSTVKLLGLGNANNKETYLATSNNWTSIRPQLVNYTTQELARLVSYLNATNTLILPKDAAISIGQWTGLATSHPGMRFSP